MTAQQGLRQCHTRYRQALALCHAGDFVQASQQVCAALQTAATLPWPPASPHTRPRLDADRALLLLSDTLTRLAQQGLVAFAYGGSLLGLVREGRLLPDDKDLDIATPVAQLDEVAAALEKIGFAPTWIPVVASNFKSFVHTASGIALDLMGIDYDAGRARLMGGWWPVGRPREEGRLLAFTPFELALCHQGKVSQWVIQQPETLLAELFGPHWRTPDPHWIGLFQTPVLVAHTPFSRLIGHLRLLEAWLSGWPQRYRQLLSVLHRLDPADPGLLGVPALPAEHLEAPSATWTSEHPVVAGLRQSLQHFSTNQTTAALAAARQALLTAATLPFPAPRLSPVGTIDTTLAQPLLVKTLADLAAVGVQAVAFGGALLGLVREGRLLPFDKDLDIVVPWPQFAVACRHLLAVGWQPARTAVQADNFRCFIDPASRITLDLFGYDFQAGYVMGGWWPTGLPREAGRLLRFSAFQLQQADSPAGRHWVIAESEAVLAELYGPTWREPDPRFDATLETPALVAYNDYTRCWGLLRLLEAWVHGQPTIYARRLQALQRCDPADMVLCSAHPHTES